MKILEMHHVEDCLDGSMIKEIILSRPLDANHIKNLGKEGKLQYYPHFARPFFKLRIDGKLNLKGIEGNTSIRARIETPVEEHIKLLTQLIHQS